jgi:hypothetical protein
VSGLTVLITQSEYSEPSLAGSEGTTISKEQKFADCVIMDKESFDPDAVFYEDIVSDEVLPKLSLAVDGLTESADSSLEIPSEDTAENEVLKPSTVMPDATLDPEQLEVYGWESSLWRKICGYLGF